MKRSLTVLLSMLVMASMLLTACGTPATEAPAAPAATDVPAAPAATDVPAAPAATDVPAPAFVGEKLAAPDCNYGGNFKGLEAIDELTVKFSFCNPEPAFLAKITLEAFNIFDQDNLKEIGGDATKMGENPIGTGPYILKEWVRGDHLTFVPNPTYFGEKAANTTFILKWNKEAAARLLDLQAGNVSGIAEVNVDDLASIKADPNLSLVPRNGHNFLYLGINNTRAPFDNESVRQAFAMAINKQKIVDDFYAPGSVAATQFVQEGVSPGYTAGYKGPAFDAAKAKQMLTDAKFDFTKTYVLHFGDRTRPYFPAPSKIAQAVQAQFADIGVKIDIQMEDWAAYGPKVSAGDYDLFFLGWGEDYPDATNWYDVFLRGSQKNFGTPHADIVELVNKAGQLGDPAERQKLYDQINVLYDQHVPMAVIAHGNTNLAFLASVGNVSVGPYNENFPQMTTADGTVIFSQDGEPISLMCTDEGDGNSFRACTQLFSKLYKFGWGSANPEPDLAEKCVGNADATEWTCTLKKGVLFSNGATLDANDVVATLSAGFDYKNPLRKGNSGQFNYFRDMFGPKGINQPPAP